jgi:hypothetical protein
MTRPRTPASLLTTYVPAVAVAGSMLVAACGSAAANRADPTARSTPASTPSAARVHSGSTTPVPILPTTHHRAAPVGSARTIMAGFESAWCPFRWNETPTARLTRARAFMTPTAAARLHVPRAWWVDQIRPNHTVATCSQAQVFAPDAPSTGSRTVLRSTITRVSEDETTGRTATESLSDQRWLVRAGGRWLVDVPTEGG